MLNLYDYHHLRQNTKKVIKMIAFLHTLVKVDDGNLPRPSKQEIGYVN